MGKNLITNAEKVFGLSWSGHLSWDIFLHLSFQARLFLYRMYLLENIRITFIQGRTRNKWENDDEPFPGKWFARFLEEYEFFSEKNIFFTFMSFWTEAFWIKLDPILNRQINLLVLESISTSTLTSSNPNTNPGTPTHPNAPRHEPRPTSTLTYIFSLYHSLSFTLSFTLYSQTHPISFNTDCQLH